MDLLSQLIIQVVQWAACLVNQRVPTALLVRLSYPGTQSHLPKPTKPLLDDRGYHWSQGRALSSSLPSLIKPYTCIWNSLTPIKASVLQPSRHKKFKLFQKDQTRRPKKFKSVPLDWREAKQKPHHFRRNLMNPSIDPTKPKLNQGLRFWQIKGGFKVSSGTA